ncbi:unnamed protein product, partial [Didymodactylos carnosus]
REMSSRVEETKGIILSQLSKECQELAVRCDCDKIPYIFALPECFIEARRAIIALETWLQDDTTYNKFVQMQVYPKTYFILLMESYVSDQ